MNYPETYYAHDAGSALSEELPDSADYSQKDYDVIIVGGGLGGLTTALETARAGKKVALFESQMIGWGASGRNGGFVSAGFSRGLPSLIERVGADRAAALFALSRDGLEYVRREAASIDPAIIGGNGWLMAFRHSAPDDAKKLSALYSSYGFDSRRVPRAELGDLLRSNRYFDAVENSGAFHIQPLLYALGLAKKARAAGVHIFENCPIKVLNRDGNIWCVVGAGKTARAQHVVLAGSAYMSGLYPRLSSAILPVATYVISSEPMAEKLDEAINYCGCISDSRRAGDYYRRLPDGRLLWGGRITTRRSEPKQLAEMLRRDILKIYPCLGEFNVSHAWSGLMGYAIHKMPIIGELEAGLWSVTGFGGQGLATTAMGGQLVASAIAENDDRWRQFSDFAPLWAGGVFGRAATQLSYWFMQIRDRKEEKGSGLN